MVMRTKDHSQCSSHVVQGELLPKIDDNIDTVLGLAVFYQYVRTAALNQQQQTQHVSVFTTELFALCLHIRCLSVVNSCRLAQMSSTDEVQRYIKFILDIRQPFATDVLLLKSMVMSLERKCKMKRATSRFNNYSLWNVHIRTSWVTAAVCSWTSHNISSAWGRKVWFCSHDCHDRLWGAVYTRTNVATIDAVYIQLSTRNVRTLFHAVYMPSISTFADIIQLCDDDTLSHWSHWH